VKGSTPSKTEKKTASREGPGNVEAPVPLDRVNEERMKVMRECETTNRRKLDFELLGTSTFEEGEWNSAPKSNTRKRKERVCSVKLFGTKNL
jgi:hypothetical protein